MTLEHSPSSKNKLNVSFDLRLVVIVLLVVLVGMLFIWKPWAARLVSDRTVSVTGTATITATPDEFLFYPSYEFKNGDKAAALAAVSQKSADVVKGLKAVGIADKDIKTTSSGYDYPVYSDTVGQPTYTLQFTVTSHSLASAQKVQDYLVSTTPQGSVSPQAAFSDKKQKALEMQARSAAAKDARAKADEMAKNIGFSVAKVKTINDAQGFGGGIRPLEAAGSKALATTDAAAPALTVQPGENDLDYTVTVEYYIR